MRGGQEDDTSIYMPAWMEEDVVSEDEEEVFGPNLDPAAEGPIDDEDENFAAINQDELLMDDTNQPLAHPVNQREAHMNQAPNHPLPVQPAVQQHHHHTLPKSRYLLFMSCFPDCGWCCTHVGDVCKHALQCF
jgi:hypothetical protein